MSSAALQLSFSHDTTPGCAKARILVAEDSADSREMMQVLLQTKGYDVVSADNGMSAVEVAVRIVPDLILMDLQLPKLDGIDVARVLRLNPKTRSVPIIILSGHDPMKYRQVAIAAGCDEYMLKPLDFDRLERLLHDVIASHHHH